MTMAVAMTGPVRDFSPSMLTDEQIRDRISMISADFGGEASLRDHEAKNVLTLDEMLALQRIDGYYYLLNGDERYA